MTEAAWFLMAVSIFAVIALGFCAALLWQWFRPAFAVVTVVAVLAPLGAWAQDSATAAAAAGAASVLPDIQQIAGAASAGKWALALVLALSLAVRFFRGPILNMLPDTNAFKVWCKGTLGGWVINIVGSEIAAVTTALLAGPPSGSSIVSALVGGLMVSMGSAGFHEFTKDTGLVASTPPPVPAPVMTAAQAADTLNGPAKP